MPRKKSASNAESPQPDVIGEAIATKFEDVTKDGALPAASEPASAESPRGGTIPSAEAAAPGSPRFATEADAKITVSLSDYKGGPRVHLVRSNRFKQMQIRFDGEQPGEEYLAMLAKAGWKDRTAEEGVWTKQIDQNARWQSVQRMEREFRDIANAIRRSKQLAPALELD
jgi:hypothetical protein